MLMTAEEFRAAFKEEISQVLGGLPRRYNVSDEEMVLALYSAVKKYLPGVLDLIASGSAQGDEQKKTRELVATLNCGDLCLTIACAKGNDAAWEDFFRDYRSYLLGVARSVTRDAAAAEQLADSTFAELYGLRGSDGPRISKFSFYSGRGSLKGWLRAVVSQLGIDQRRQNSRFVQTEEAEEMDRLAQSSRQEERPSVESAFIRQRYREATTESLKVALSQMESRDRLLLAYYYCDEMTLKEIGRIFEVHEATASRWVTKAQKNARKFIEKRLERHHRFGRNEVREAMEIAAHEVDLNVREYLTRSVTGDRVAAKGRLE